jgi:transposase
MECHVTTSERIDDLPLLVSWLQQMRVDVIIDEALGPPHGNWSGLSYGEVSLVLLAHMLMCCTHFLSPVQEWIAQHQAILCHVLGKPVRPQDATDDRLALLLERLGKAKSPAAEQIERELGRHLIRAYALPTQTARIDMTSVSVHHQPHNESGLLRFGHSKDHRPDLRQFKEALGTLDPCGVPLVTATLSGEQADDPNYLPVWEKMVTIIGRTDFLVVGDCKLASLPNRAHIQKRGGFYLTPLPMTGNTPAQLQEWVLNPPTPPTPIRLPDQSPSDPPVGEGFEVERTSSWLDPDTKTTYSWTERHLLVQSEVYAQTLRRGLQERLQKAQAALEALNSKPRTDQAPLQQQAQAILKRYRVQEYLQLHFSEEVLSQTHYVGPGRPGPKRDTQTTQTCLWTVEATYQVEEIAEFNALAGWRIYVTNTTPERLSLTGAVDCYRQEWQPEHGFHRLKGGLLAITPLYLRDDDRLRGLLLLLGIALRVLTLTEFVVRRDLWATGETLKGLYDGNPNRATDQPTGERLLKAFHNITLYRHQTPERIWYEVTPLSLLHRRILRAMGIPESIYSTPPAPQIRSG